MPTFTNSHWQAVQKGLKDKLGDVVYESWMQPLTFCESKTTDDAVTVQAPTRFVKDWVQRNYTTAIQETIAEALGGAPMAVTFEVAAPAAQPAAPQAAATPSQGNSQGSTPNEMVQQVGQAIQSSSAPKPAVTPLTGTQSKAPEKSAGLLDAGNPLDTRFTFDNFVTGKSNEFAYAAAKRIAESEDAAYNPFLLYGGVGLGKTHLMHAMALHIREHQPKRRVLYISSEKFVYQFIRSLRDKKTMDFKEAFRSVDVLMIDDIQFIAGKEATQEEFFHTLNALIDMRKQVILTADKSPHEMDNVEDRLRSRLGWGLTTEIHKPDLETRLAILDSKAAEMNIELPKDVAMVLADKVSSNVRELEGAFNRLVAHADLIGCPITLDTAQSLLKDIFQASNRQITLDEIQVKVADYYRIKLHEMHTARRSRDVARPRQVAMYLSKRLTQKSFPDIGKAFGGRDHTTVMHGVKAIEKLMQTDKQMADDVQLIEKMLTSS